jgi:hypothetical protein
VSAVVDLEFKSSPLRRSAVSSRRELIDTGSDKPFVRRHETVLLKESENVGRSVATDRRHAKTESKPGQGDRGENQTS